MNKNVLINEHAGLQIKTESRELENELENNQLAFAQMRSTLVRMKQELYSVKEERMEIQNKIRTEKSLARDRDQEQDFFTAISTNSQEDDLSQTFEIPAKMVDQLRKQLTEKQSVLTVIEPVISCLNKKIIFSLTKRQQRKRLNKLRKQLSRDIGYLQKALDFISG